MYQLQTSKMGVLQSFGRFKRIIHPGLHIINPWTEDVINVDLKTVVRSLHPQQVLTKDNVTVRIETSVYYRVVDPYKLVYKLGKSTD